jgi:hypothetical protein
MKPLDVKSAMKLSSETEERLKRIETQLRERNTIIEKVFVAKPEILSDVIKAVGELGLQKEVDKQLK